MINNKWPEVPVDKIRGPFMKIQKRVSDDDPWHELMKVKKGVTYKEKVSLHWQLSVKKGILDSDEMMVKPLRELIGSIKKDMLGFSSMLKKPTSITLSLRTHGL